MIETRGGRRDGRMKRDGRRAAASSMAQSRLEQVGHSKISSRLSSRQPLFISSHPPRPPILLSRP